MVGEAFTCQPQFLQSPTFSAHDVQYLTSEANMRCFGLLNSASFRPANLRLNIEDGGVGWKLTGEYVEKTPHRLHTSSTGCKTWQTALKAVPNQDDRNSGGAN